MSVEIISHRSNGAEFKMQVDANETELSVRRSGSGGGGGGGGGGGVPFGRFFELTSRLWWLGTRASAATTADQQGADRVAVAPHGAQEPEEAQRERVPRAPSSLCR